MLKRGDYAKVIVPPNEEPEFGWGNIESGEIGIVGYCNGKEVHIDFPTYIGWHGLVSEFELSTKKEYELSITEEAIKERAKANKNAFLERAFEKTKEGYIVYKTFGQFYESPEKWIIEPNSIIEETVDLERCFGCSFGINVATLDWVKESCGFDHYDRSFPIWKCLIRHEWLDQVCVPIGTDGKIRAGKVQLLEIIER